MSTPDLDTVELESYLSRELDVVVAGTEVLHDGLNLSVAISTAETERTLVLRRPNEFRQRGSFNDVPQECEVLRHLEETDIDAPEPVLVCDDGSILGDPFLVITYLKGETIPPGSDLPKRFRNPAARHSVATQLVDTLAELHAVDEAPFEGVCDRRPLQEQVARIVDQFDEATSVTGHDHASLWRVADWLRENAPSDSGTALVHGDYRPGNVLFAGTNSRAITGVLDWETAFLGDPLTELGYLLLRWRDDGDPRPPLDAFSARHSNADALRDLRAFDVRGLAPFTNDPGSPSRGELVARYEDRAGFAFGHEQFYRAFAAFILATVWEDLHGHRIEAGADSNREPYIEYVSTIASSIVDGEFEL